MGGETFGGGAQAAITPFSVAKMNRLGFLVASTVLGAWKSAEPLKTIPVGLPPGIVTTNDCLLPSPSYSVDLPVPLSAIQTKPLGLKAIPQAFTRSESVWSAVPDMLETRLCCI